MDTRYIAYARNETTDKLGNEGRCPIVSAGMEIPDPTRSKEKWSPEFLLARMFDAVVWEAREESPLSSGLIHDAEAERHFIRASKRLRDHSGFPGDYTATDFNYPEPTPSEYDAAADVAAEVATELEWEWPFGEDNSESEESTE
jgi:hypothetical protein